MDDFSSPGVGPNAFGYSPAPANYIRPGKRPLSSISPVIVEDAAKLPVLITGAAGGSWIITANVQNVMHVIVEGMNATSALAMPRLHNQLAPNITHIEKSYDQSVAAGLVRLGENVELIDTASNTAQAILITSTKNTDGMSFEAVGEPRQANSGGAVF